MIAVTSIDAQFKYLKSVISKGGPTPDEWESYQAWLDEAVLNIKAHRYKISDIYLFYEAFGDALSVETMQGFCLRKPHGYAGDFEIIERMYRQQTSSRADLRNWDLFFHSRPASKAVRNRKDYFKNLLVRKLENHTGTLRVLNVASGPSRDMYEFLEEYPDAPIEFVCVDMDESAIDFSKKLLHNNLHRIQYIHKNIFRFQTDQKFDLIWSAGLFDYFNDKIFTRVLSRFKPWLLPSGEVVVGNFSNENPSIHYMDLVDWILTHRSEDELVNLANEAGYEDAKKLFVGSEPEGVNLFLHASYE